MSTDIPPLRSDQIYSGALIHTRFNLRITTIFHLKYNNLLYVSISYVVCFIIYPTSKDRKSSPDDPLIINASVVFFVCFIIYPTSKDRKSSPDDPLIINDSVVFFCFSFYRTESTMKLIYHYVTISNTDIINSMERNIF